MSPQRLFSPEKIDKQLSVLKEQTEECIKTEPEIEIVDTEEHAEPETSELTNELTEEEVQDLLPATEIKLSFSPKKLQECFTQQVNERQAERQTNIQTFEERQREADDQFKASQTHQSSKSTTFNANFMDKIRQKRSESAESPRQKEMKFKQLREKRLKDIEQKLAKWD